MTRTNWPAVKAYEKYDRERSHAPEPKPVGWKFDGFGQIFPAVLIAETGEVVDFVKYRNLSVTGLFWVGAPADHNGEGRPWHGPYEVTFNVQEGYFVAFARVK